MLARVTNPLPNAVEVATQANAMLHTALPAAKAFANAEQLIKAFQASGASPQVVARATEMAKRLPDVAKLDIAPIAAGMCVFCM